MAMYYFSQLVGWLYHANIEYHANEEPNAGMRKCHAVETP